jgi:hypothetical protein
MLSVSDEEKQNKHNLEKLTTQDTQDEEKQNKNNLEKLTTQDTQDEEKHNKKFLLCFSSSCVPYVVSFS